MNLEEINELPYEFPFSKEDLYKEWSYATHQYGCYDLKTPNVVFDPNSSETFYINMETIETYLNCFHIPQILPKEQYLWWMSQFAIQHELAHYHTCPFTSQNVIENIIIVEQMWKTSNERILYALNCFYDLIVDYFLSKTSNEFILGCIAHFEWVLIQTAFTQMKTSYICEIFIRIHELYWHLTYSLVPSIRKEENEIALKIAKKIINEDDKKEILVLFIDLLKPYFEMEAKDASVSTDILIPNKKEAYEICQKHHLPSLEEIQKDLDSPTSLNFNFEESDSKDSKMDSNKKLSLEELKSIQSSSLNQNENKIPYRPTTTTKKNGITISFDMTLATTPFDPKLQSNMSSENKFNFEKSKMLESVMSKGNGVIPSISKFMMKYGLASDSFDAIRMILRIKADKLIDYTIKCDSINGSYRNGLKEWGWSDKLADWNLKKSLNICPVFPFPPYAKKWIYTDGEIGKSGKNYRDLLIGLDTSGSMGGISSNLINKGNCETVYDYALLSTFALFNAAVKKNVKIALINFSDNIYATKWLTTSTTHIEHLENCSLNFQDQGTTFPLQKFRKRMNENSNCLIIIVTDYKLSNTEELIIFDLEAKQKHIPIFIIKIDPYTLNNNKSKSIIDNLTSDGINIITIKNQEDLPLLTLQLSQKYF